MKTFLIIILSLALLGAAFFTRPNESDFRRHVAEQYAADSGNLLDQFLNEGRAEDLLAGCTFKDRFLWVNVEKDGKTAYTGLFDHWFDHGAIGQKVDAAKKVQPVAEKVVSDAVSD